MFFALIFSTLFGRSGLSGTLFPGRSGALTGIGFSWSRPSKIGYRYPRGRYGYGDTDDGDFGRFRFVPAVFWRHRDALPTTNEGHCRKRLLLAKGFQNRVSFSHNSVYSRSYTKYKVSAVRTTVHCPTAPYHTLWHRARPLPLIESFRSHILRSRHTFGASRYHRDTHRQHCCNMMDKYISKYQI